MRTSAIDRKVIRNEPLGHFQYWHISDITRLPTWVRHVRAGCSGCSRK